MGVIMPRTNRLTRFVRPHATYVYEGGRVITQFDPAGRERRRIHADEFGMMSLERMAMWLDDWEERAR
jgi:hypothetical protein